MRIVHISDLHFGKENAQVISALLAELGQLNPDLVVVSGDLTQRARRGQFIKAAEFLKMVCFSKIVVPGNHDVPLYDVFRRFLTPFKRYAHYINADFFPVYKNKCVSVMGLNTAHSFTWKSGRVTADQRRVLANELQKAPDSSITILVAHHPFREIFKKKCHEELANFKLDIICSGHLHRSSMEILDSPIAKLNHKTLLLQAGTTTSNRLRGENNAFNCIDIGLEGHLSVTVKEFDGHAFTDKHHRKFMKQNGRWIRGC